MHFNLADLFERVADAVPGASPARRSASRVSVCPAASSMRCWRARPGSLARTGTVDVAAPLALAAMLVLSGAGLAIVALRRRDALGR